MTSSHPVSFAIVVIALSTLSNCLDPTEIVVDIKTDVACNVVSQRGVTIAIGKPGDDPNAQVLATSSCDGGDIGTVVITPSGDVGEAIGIRVVLGVDKQAEQCTPLGFDGCIVARRSLRYAPHTPLTLPIDVDQDCLSHLCDPSSTCLHGSCVDAGVSCLNNTCSLPDAGPPPDAGGCVSTTPLTSNAFAATPRIARAPNGYVIAWLTSGASQLMVETVDATGATIATAVQIATANVTAKVDAVSLSGSNYVVLHEANGQLELTFVDVSGGIVGSPGWGTTVGPLGGLFFETQTSQFVTAGIVSGTSQLLTATPGSAMLGAVLTTASVTGVALARGPNKYYATMHDSAACYVVPCTLQGAAFVCANSTTIGGCTGIRMAANANDTLQMQVGSQLTAVDTNTAQTTILGAVDSPDAILPLATGSTPFRALWRTNDKLQEQTLPATSVVAIDAMGYSAAGGTGAGFDAVADDEATSTGYAIVYWKNGGLWFTHRCN